MLHPIRVAMCFKPTTHQFWLALVHDLAEDYTLFHPLTKIWPALDHITRRPDEVYRSEYIIRVMEHPIAMDVKLADLYDNRRRCPESLRSRYNLAIRMIEDRKDDATI